MLLADKDAAVEHIVKHWLIYRVGGLFKAGLLIVNSCAVVQAAKQIADEDRLKALDAAQKKKE
jgi:hypothetical protein